MRKVLKDKSEVAHFFANQLQSEGKAGNVFFQDDTIYSYGRHFAIAHHVKNAGGEDALLFTTRSYSVSTSAHISTVSRACNHLNTIMCPYPDSSQTQNFEYWLKAIEGIYPDLSKAKKPEIYLNKISNISQQITAYTTFFGYQIPAKLKAAMAITSKDEFAQYDSAKKELEEKERKTRERQLKTQHTKELKKFYNREITTLTVRDGWDYLRFNKETNRIETTQRVEVPLQKATAFYRLAKAVIKKGGCINCEHKLLDYSVNAINAEFIHIGCHKITMKEVTRLALELGLN